MNLLNNDMKTMEMSVQVRVLFELSSSANWS